MAALTWDDVAKVDIRVGRIVEVEERTTVLRRTADDDDPYERPIVANADQLVIVTALADPPPRTGMIDRILVADRRGDRHPGEPVAGRRVVRTAQADRQRQRDGVDRHPEHLVVPA